METNTEYYKIFQQKLELANVTFHAKNAAGYKVYECEVSKVIHQTIPSTSRYKPQKVGDIILLDKYWIECPREE